MKEAHEDQDFVVAAYNHDGALIGCALADVSPPCVDDVLPGATTATALGNECPLHAELSNVLNDL